MSGRTLTIIALAGCFAMVALALWQRSRTTEQVRKFWGAEQARLIQHGPVVQLRFDEEPWRDISQAPGLVHLRATLVDDRYYQWNDLHPATAPASYRLRFEEGDAFIELGIDPDSGIVTNLNLKQAVPLIPASARAVKAYLREIR